MPGDKPSAPKAGVIAPPPLVFLAGVVLGLGADYLFALPGLPRAEEAGGLWLGLAFGGSGLFLILWAARCLDRAGTAIVPYRPSKVLVTEGPYRRSRNPIYLGMALIYLGVVCATASLSVLVLFPLVFLVMEFGVIRREERYLTRRFGQKYLAYTRAVRRWL